MAWDVVIHAHGSDATVTLPAVGAKAEAQRVARDLVPVRFPGCTAAWSGSGKTALLVKRDGAVIGTIAIEPHTGKAIQTSAG